MGKFEIEIASLPTREDLVAEIFYDDDQWAQISKIDGELLVQFYSPSKDEFWEFPLDNVLLALEKAKKKLLAIG